MVEPACKWPYLSTKKHEYCSVDDFRVNPKRVQYVHIVTYPLLFSLDHPKMWTGPRKKRLTLASGEDAAILKPYDEPILKLCEYFDTMALRSFKPVLKPCQSLFQSLEKVLIMCSIGPCRWVPNCIFTQLSSGSRLIDGCCDQTVVAILPG